MTPAARASAAIEILDRILGGAPAERALTNWARGSRFAGSGDRAAIRDIVFDCLRCRASYAARAGRETGRGLVLGHFAGQADALFTGERHAPSVLSDDERAALTAAAAVPDRARFDLPDWLIAKFEASLGAQALEVADVLRARAPVTLRVALSRISRDAAQEMLLRDGIITRPLDTVKTALQVIEKPRKVAQSSAYLDGLVELQDASSQAICLALPSAARMLDYCAGGGGKTLAYADRSDARLFAHDGNPERMKDLPARAARAGKRVEMLSSDAVATAVPFDLVLVDAPCSGSGTWRRSPEEKWSLTPERLADLEKLQAEILDKAAALVAPGGHLVYVTCSVLESENNDQIQKFGERHSDFDLGETTRFLPNLDGDGFYSAHLTRRSGAS